MQEMLSGNTWISLAISFHFDIDQAESRCPISGSNYSRSNKHQSFENIRTLPNGERISHSWQEISMSHTMLNY